MSAYVPPPEYVVKFRSGHVHGSFTTYSERDAIARAAAWKAAGFEVDFDPIPRAEIPEGLRPFEEVA